jgi:hypothetical protein
VHTRLLVLHKLRALSIGPADLGRPDTRQEFSLTPSVRFPRVLAQSLHDPPVAPGVHHQRAQGPQDRERRHPTFVREHRQHRTRQADQYRAVILRRTSLGTTTSCCEPDVVGDSPGFRSAPLLQNDSFHTAALIRGRGVRRQLLLPSTRGFKRPSCRGRR